MRKDGTVAELSVLGVDPGTRKAGLAAVSASRGLVFHRAVTLNGGDPNVRVARLYTAVSRALDRSKAAVLAIENPSHPRNARTAHLLGRAVGVCTLAAVQRGLLVLEYRPSQIRRAAVLVHRRWPTSRRWDDDEVDAAAAALLALSEPIQGAGRRGERP